VAKAVRVRVSLTALKYRLASQAIEISDRAKEVSWVLSLVVIPVKVLVRLSIILMGRSRDDGISQE
jgi:hypothetical protein